MGLKNYFSQQAKKPTGLFGRLIMSIVFNYGNNGINNFVKENIRITGKEHILEIGFGTGKLIYRIAKLINTGLIVGIDTSKVMTEIAIKRNKRFIQKGVVELLNDDFDVVELKENEYDLIYTINTIYFWKNPKMLLKKIFQILKQNSILVIAFEDKTKIEVKKLNKEIFSAYTKEEIEKMIKDAGFKETYTFTRKTEKDYFHCTKAIK